MDPHIVGYIVMDSDVKAAGGLICFDNGKNDTTEVILIHRPRYQDWSFPKGKLDFDESFEAAAIREVYEETGLECRIGPLISTTHYYDRSNRPKEVRYFLMHEKNGHQLRPEPHYLGMNEVDRVIWLPLKEAENILTYDRYKKVLEDLQKYLSQL
jgi:8-oxo-dGTP pyrophosphatase MutT (NUDIX family)